MVDQNIVQRWLADFSMEVEQVDPGENAWALRFSGEESFNTFVAQRAVDWNHLVMQVSLKTAPEHDELIRALPEKTQQLFQYDLKIALLQQPVGHQFVFADDDANILERVHFGYNVLEDPISRAGFFRRNHQLQSAALLTVMMIRKLALLEDWSV